MYQKKTKEVIEKHMREMNHISSIMELTRTGARMMLQIAIEEELLAFLDPKIDFFRHDYVSSEKNT